MHLENEKISFQAWKSPGKKENTEESPGNVLETFEKYTRNYNLKVFFLKG